jgi:intraflagellar transport protein 122
MEMNEPDSAVELYERIKDIPTVVKMKLVTKDWDYLLALADREPFHREAVLLPYAEFLVENDRFIEARKAFAQAGRPEEASKILSQLARVSVSIGRFGDASFYSWLLGKASEESSRQYPESAEAHRLQSERFFILADIYNAYALVHGTIQDPFSSLSIETVFNAARILAAILWNLKEMPDGVRMANVLYVLAVWAMKSDAFKTARIALERLKELSLPKTLQGRFTVSVWISIKNCLPPKIKIFSEIFVLFDEAFRVFFLQEVFVQNRTRPFQDPQDLSDFCHTCSSFNPLLNVRCGYSCLACGSPFLNCPVSFEHLPLVEFHLASDITQSDALSVLAAEKSSRPAMEPTNDMMSFDQTSVTAGLNNDRFFADFQRTGVIVVDEKMLRDLREEEVVVLKLASPKRWRFLRNMLPEVVRLSACTSCWKIFNHDDFFASILELKCCPFCREPVKIRVDEE